MCLCLIRALIRLSWEGFFLIFRFSIKAWSAMMLPSLFTHEDEAFCQWLLCGENDLSANYSGRDVRPVDLRASAAYAWFWLNQIWPWISDNSEIRWNNKRRTGCTLKHSMTHRGPLIVTHTLIRLDRLVMSTVVENLMGDVPLGSEVKRLLFL